MQSNENQGAQNKSTVDQHLLEKISGFLEEARSKLVDRNLRNKLINTALQSSRSKNLKIYDELSDQVFSCLVADKKAMTFKGVPDKQAVEVDEENDSLIEYSPEDLEVEVDPNRHLDTILQTKLTVSGLEKKLRALYYESSDYEEEQGVNILYLSLGFLKWYEDVNSNVERYAPLILLPVVLERDGSKERYQLKVRDEDLFTNISLKLWLKEQHSIELPELPEDEELKPSEYFRKVKEAISKTQKWEVLDNEILLGFFSFSKFLLWKDLDPESWPKNLGILEHPSIQKLLGSSFNDEPVVPEPPIIPPNELVDDHFTPHELVYVLDADSSQTEAIQSAVSGSDVVIQGPPGTGKSQTITNIISAAVHNGKKVLFVAEKMAALEVVLERLKKTNLGPLCFELHSRKSSKSAVLDQLRQSIDLSHQARPALARVDQLTKVQSTLNSHSKRLNSVLEEWGFSPFEILGLINKLIYQGIAPSNYDIKNASAYSKEKLIELTEELEQLVQHLVVSGIPDKHPWRFSKKALMSPLDMQRLGDLLNAAASSLAKLTSELDDLAKAINLTNSGRKFDEHSFIKDLIAVGQLLKNIPKIPLPILTSNYLKNNLAELERYVDELEKASENNQELRNLLIEGWSKHNVFSLRVKLAGSGGSIFSIFNRSYREAVSELKGLSLVEIPKTFSDRLSLLDKAIETNKLEESLAGASPDLRSALGQFGLREVPEPEKLKLILEWYRNCQKLSSDEFELVGELAKLDNLDSRIELLNEVHKNWESKISDVLRMVEVDINDLNLYSLQNDQDQLSTWKESVSRFNEWPPVRDQLSSLEQKLGEGFVSGIRLGDVQAADIKNVCMITIYEEVWKSMVEKLPELATLDGQTLNSTLSQFRSLDLERLNIASGQIMNNYINSRPNGFSGSMGIIRQELNKKKRHMAVRRLIKEAGSAIQELKPIFLMSPISLAQYVPPGSIMFDMIIIDEASQVRPEDALGAIARAKQIVVVGDDKQLPPTNFFNRITDDDSPLNEDDADFAVSNLESILSLGNISIPNQKMLRWHYRSQHPGLIAVSNRNFYDDELLLPPSTLIDSYSDGLGVSMIKSPQNSYERGGTNGGRNVIEAELIAKAVIDFARKTPELSLGVATFSVRQRDAVRDLIDNYRRKNPELEFFFSGSKNEPFFVKNLESIQGDERDVIFISVGYGRDQNGKLTQTFGPLGQDGGERRLNVLISRAKQRCTVFSSITAEDIKLGPGKLGVNAFKEFLQFAEKGYFDVPVVTNKDFDSDFEESVATFLRKNGYKLQPQVGMSGFFIDIGVIDPESPNRYICGIECDGATYHSSRSARDRDRIRQSVLESRGWNIYRIWSTDWFHRRAEQERRLLDYLTELIENDGKSKCLTSETPQTQPVEELHETVSEETHVEVDQRVVPYVEYDTPATISLLPHQVDISTIATYVTKIVNVEGPIHEEEVARRLAKVFGLEKAGSRIQELTKKALVKAKLVLNGKFWSSQTQQKPIKIRIRSNVISRTLTQAEYLPDEEILEALIYVITQNVSITRAELIPGVSKLFGFNRCGPDLNDAISKVLDKYADNFVIDSSGSYKVKK